MFHSLKVYPPNITSPFLRLKSTRKWSMVSPIKNSIMPKNTFNHSGIKMIKTKEVKVIMEKADKVEVFNAANLHQRFLDHGCQP